eukprot:m.67295 g.67295  ORF g.67295 m.67295 type:complete len:320 (+) comp23793_c0_seq1:170-1129(+)
MDRDLWIEMPSSSDQFTALTAHSSVTSIKPNSLEDSPNRFVSISVSLPNSVTSIAHDGFGGSESLTSVVIPNSVTSIGESAFCGCSGLTAITISNAVRNIPVWTFGFCKALTSIEIPDSVTSIGASAFWGCSSLTSIKLPNSVNRIGNSAFYNCANLDSVEIPNSVVSIERNAFSFCGLTCVVMLDSLEHTPIIVDPHAFEHCLNLKLVIASRTIRSKGFLRRNSIENFPIENFPIGGEVLSTRATRLQGMRMRFWSPASHTCYSDPRRVFTCTVMLVALRLHNFQSERTPSLPPEIWMCILRHLRPHSIGIDSLLWKR